MGNENFCNPYAVIKEKLKVTQVGVSEVHWVRFKKTGIRMRRRYVNCEGDAQIQETIQKHCNNDQKKSAETFDD